MLVKFVGLYFIQSIKNDKFFTQILAFLHTIAHQIGLGALKLIALLFPNVTVPENLGDTIGYLSMITIFVILTQVARKIAWIIVVIGWILIGIRVLLIILGKI